MEILQRGAEYLSLRNHPGYKRLMRYLEGHCLDLLHRLEESDGIPADQVCRIVDVWRASELMYQRIQSEVNSAVENAKILGAEMEQEGLSTFNLDMGEEHG